MKITGLDTTLVDVPLPAPVGTAIHTMRSVGCVLVRMSTDEGLVGESFVFTLDGVRLRVFDEMVRGLSAHAIGRDPHDVGAIWHEIWMAINPTGHKGVTIAGLSAIDIACWDLIGKAAGQPLHRLFGACRDDVDTYATSGLWLSTPLDELAAEAQGYVDAGFRAVKLRIGSARIDDDVERVRIVRDAIGPEIGLLVDANQAFSAKHAIRLGRRLDDFELTWIEEPVAVHDLAGSADVRAALDTPIAAGETEYTRYGMQAMLDARAADVLMPDLQRIGGYSEFRIASAAAAARDVPVSSHFFTEYSLAVAGATPNCISVEHVDWFAPLFTEEVELRDGRLVVPKRPGTGFTFRPDVEERFPFG
ncbi:MAG: mandelate racemase/muconate lactonizing enzyme family protein [Actinomycetota bacterium]